MGTSNFYQPNTSHVYKVLDYEYDEYFDGYDIYRDELIDTLHHDFNSIHNKKWIFFDAINEPYNNSLRSYPANIFGKINSNKSFDLDKNNQIEICLEFDLVIISGYYHAANLDYFVNISFEPYDKFDSSDKEWYLKDAFNDNKKLYHLVDEWITTEIKRINKHIENIYKANSNMLECFAKFSNGETIYKSI